MRRVLDHRAESKFLFQKSEKAKKIGCVTFSDENVISLLTQAFTSAFFGPRERTGPVSSPSRARLIGGCSTGERGGTVGRGRLDDQGKPLVKIFSIWNLFLFTISDHFVACNWVFYVWSEAGPQVVECWSMDISKLGSSPTVGPEQSTFQHV